MDCLNSIAPTDEELISLALDGEALPGEANNHLQQCETCKRRLASYKQVNAYLLSHLYRSQCPSGEQLSLYCADLLPADERMSIASHVKDCPLCATEVEQSRSFLRMDVELPASSFSLRALLHPIFATRVISAQPQFAVRGDASAAAWPRKYNAESVDLTFHLSLTSSGEHMLLGIMTGIDPTESVDAFEGVAAELYTSPGPLVASGDKPAASPLLRTQGDDLGHFVFKPVPTGQFVIVVYLPDRELVIEDLSIE
jgi:hypothetical protein